MLLLLLFPNVMNYIISVFNVIKVDLNNHKRLKVKY